MIDLRDNVGKYISLSCRHMQAYMAKRMEPLNIGVGQYVYLFRLYFEDGQSQQRLSDELLVDKAATVRAINKLEEAGYVVRKPDPADKRSFRIFLTDKGRNIRPKLEEIVEEVLEILLKDMSVEERQLLKKLMRQVMGNMVEAVRNS